MAISTEKVAGSRMDANGWNRNNSRRTLCGRKNRRPPVRSESAMQYVRSADRTFVHRVNLTEVDFAIEKHLQFFVAWLAGDHAGHCVAVFTEDPQSLCHPITASLGMFSPLCDNGLSFLRGR
ncbi:MAG TPA: hypothetical protein VM165_26235 [Planctomycetaceae bacterium]|nr:hypothetical protein [Planctomycetaceae bacterium]